MELVLWKNLKFQVSSSKSARNLELETWNLKLFISLPGLYRGRL
jgi:hypothetical protein